MNIQTLKTIVLGLVLAIGIQYAAAWTNPAGSAPGNNVAAPINIGSVLQQKDGSLAVNTSLTNPYTIGLTVFGKIQIVDGTQGAGKVLVSDENGIGHWADAATSTSSTAFTHTIQLSGSGTWTVPAGVTVIKMTVVGAGGGGGGGQSGDSWGSTGYGGAAGGIAIGYMRSLTPGASLSYAVGNGGAGSCEGYTCNGSAGSATTFNGIVAGGGGGGTGGANGYTSTNGGTVAANQTATVGTADYAMTKGAAAPATGGNYGSGGAGADGYTGYPTGITGSYAPSTSSGGGDSRVSGVGAGGNGAGAGGGGGGRRYSYGGSAGGAGAPGTILVEY